MCISTVMIVQKLPYVPYFLYTAVAFELPAQHFYPPVATALGIVPFGFKLSLNCFGSKEPLGDGEGLRFDYGAFR